MYISERTCLWVFGRTLALSTLRLIPNRLWSETAKHSGSSWHISARTETTQYSVSSNIEDMAITGIFHHIGTFFLLVATVLLVITSISAPVVNDIGLLKVQLSNATSEHWTEVSFGSFGYCVLDTA